MKRGDNVYCKKTFRTCQAFFVIDEWYEINEIKYSEPSKIKLIEVFYAVGQDLYRYHTFTEDQFINYFLTESEIRKLKLQKIQTA